ncbi:MAG: hypothetical protein K6T75_01405 [Acetobacteraceae bacterium]|nr:hypothetical protein [Acetobacteraceae bacterium]
MAVAGRARYRFELYERLEKNRARIMEQISRVPDQVGVPAEMKGAAGLLGGSGCHATLRKAVSDAMDAGSRRLISLKDLDAELRRVVKDIYGDRYDAIAVNTCEAGLHVAFDALVSPPIAGRGEPYRACYVAPYERHIHHQAGYGRPFPPMYKDITSDRGVTAGEYGMLGKRLAGLETVLVRLAGADYTVHGIKSHPCTLLLNVDPQGSIAALRRAAEVHASSLAAFASMAYNTPGYGYGVHDADGAPVLQKLMGSLAREYGVPYITDNARGTPALGVDPGKIGADVMVYSTDKAFCGPTGGLVIGLEEPMSALRRALGVHSQRWGTTAAHGKSAYVAFDPGKEALLGIIKSLELLRDDPDQFTRPVDDMYAIVAEEFAGIGPEWLRRGLVITKSYNQLAVEINYENTWKGRDWGFPIFTIEDMYAGSNLLQSALPAMGFVAGLLAYDANIVMGPAVGTADENGQLIEGRMRPLIKCLVRVMEVIASYVDA